MVPLPEQNDAERLAKASGVPIEKIRTILELEKTEINAKIRAIKTDLEAFEFLRKLPLSQIKQYNVILQLTPIIVKSAMDLKTTEEVSLRFMNCPDDDLWRPIYDDQIDRLLLIEAGETEDVWKLKSLLKKCPKDENGIVRGSRKYITFKMGEVINNLAPTIVNIGYGLELWPLCHTNDQREKVEHYVNNISDFEIAKLGVQSTKVLYKTVMDTKYDESFICLKKRLMKHLLQLLPPETKAEDNYDISAVQQKTLDEKDNKSYYNIAERRTNPSKICVLLSKIGDWVQSRKKRR